MALTKLRLILDHGDDALDHRWAAVIETKLRSLGHDVRRAAETLRRDSEGALESAAETTERMVVLLSRTYVADGMTRVRERLRRSGEAERLVVLRLDDVPTPPEFHQSTVTDLRKLTNEQLRTALAAALRQRSGSASGATDEAFQGALGASRAAARALSPPSRDPAFVGRRGLIEQLRNGLRSQGPVVLQGPAGVGKTAIVVEFVHRYSSEYDRTVWIDAGAPELVPGQLRHLAVAAGLCPPTSTIIEAQRALKRHLLKRERWLLVFDDARPAAVTELNLGAGRWHMVITSREPGWDRVATAIPVGGFGRQESLELLRRKVRWLPRAAAEEFAESLADDALGLFQAAGALAAGTVTIDELRARLDQPSDSPLLSAHRATTTVLAAATVSHLSVDDLAAADLLSICSLLAADWVPLDLFTAAPVGLLPPALASAAAEPRRFSAVTNLMARLQLVSLGQKSIKLSDTARAAITEEMSDGQREAMLDCAQALIVVAKPDDGRDPRHWPRWRQLMPHLRALVPEDQTTNELLQSMLNSALVSMIERGDVELARPIARSVHAALEARRAPGHRATSVAAQTYAMCLRAEGDYLEAYELDNQVYELYRNELGKKDPVTLEAAARVARDLSGLRRHKEALALIRRTHNVAREVLGVLDPLTLAYGDAFGLLLLAAKEAWAARSQLERTLEDRTRILGMHHRDTLATQAALADVFTAMGDLDTAKWHYQRVLRFRKQQLGGDHPETADSEEAVLRVTRAIEAAGRRKRSAAAKVRAAPVNALEVRPRPLRFVALAEEWSSAHGGISTYNRHLCQALAAAGHAVTCVVLSLTPEDEKSAYAAGVDLRIAGHIADDEDPNRLALVGNLPDGLDPDFIIGHSRHTSPAAVGLTDALAHRSTESARVKRLHFIHFSPEELERYKLGREGDPGERAAKRRLMEIRLGGTAHRVITVGPTLFKRYAADFEHSGPPVIELNPGFDAVGAARSEPPPGLPRVLMLGRMEDPHLKGLNVAAEALGRAAREEVGQFAFFVVGAPDFSSAELTRDILRQSGLPSSNVNVLPYLNDAAELERLFASASLLLMPSRAEGFGLVGQEAITRGVPVLVSGSSGLGELLRDTPELRAGDIVVPVTDIGNKDKASWSRAIARVLLNREAAFARAEKLRTDLSTALPWSTVAESLVKRL